jgi:2,3-bisphosphoglycerate-independent phosphoglycerate mutase
MRGVSLGSGPLYAGLAAAVGLDHREFGTASDPFDDVAVRVEATLALLSEGYEFVHLHTKRADMAGHRKDPAHKAEIIAGIDRALAPLVTRAESGEIIVAVCPDHQTPSAGPLYHGGGAVPLTIAGGVAGADSVTAYGERACAHGSLGVLRGTDVLPLTLDAADRSAFLADRITGHRALGVPRPEDLKGLRAAE